MTDTNPANRSGRESVSPEEDQGTDQSEAKSVDRLFDDTIAEPESLSRPPEESTPSSTPFTEVTVAQSAEEPSTNPTHIRSGKPVQSRVTGSQDELLTVATNDISGNKLGHPLPEQIGKFRVTKELGRGGFGVVYLCIDEELQRNVAIKVTHVSDQSLQERLRIEAAKVAQIESHGIVPVYHIGKTDDGNVYIVQKYIQGPSLGGLLKKSRLSPLAATEILRDIAQGLEPAHSKDILHRDLKPDNVLIDDSGQAWIADFGLAISEEEQEGCPREFAGTPPYMAPEQINGRIDFMDPRSDIWALGVMYYEMLTGKRPFRGKDRKTLQEQICELDPRPLQQRDPEHLTEAMNDIFLRCCAKKPSDRYATVRELADDLEDLIADGLSDQIVSGQSVNSVAGDSLGTYSGLRSRRMSRRATARGSTIDATGRDVSYLQGHPSEDSMLQPVRWLPSWVAGVAVVLGVIVLSIVGGVGYQMYVASTAPTKDLPEKTETLDATKSVAEQPILSADTDAASGRQDSQDAADDETMDRKALAIEPENSAITNQMGLNQANGSTEKPWIVAADGSGSHRTISAAIAAGLADSEQQPVSATTRVHIRVKPGNYDEVIRITSPVTIEGVPERVSYADGEKRYPCQIQSDQATPLLVDVKASSEFVELKYFTISGRRRDATREFNAIDLTAGTLVLRNCDLSTMSFNCVKARNGSRLATFDCNFHDSFQFAISTDEHEQLVAVNSNFFGDGIQLTSGTGRISGCNFYGSEGVYVSHSVAPVSIEDCKFTGNLDYGIAATNRGNVVARKNSFLDCKKGVWVMIGDDVDDQPSDDLPATLELVDTTLAGCETSVLVEGGTLIAKKDCKIERGRIGLSVTTGNVSLTDTLISEIAEHALSVSGMAKVTLENCIIELTDAAAIQLSKGDLTVRGGRIVDYKSAGIIVGSEKNWPMALAKCSLHDVKISETNAPGIIAFSGPVNIEKVTLEGGLFGLMAVGPDVQDLDSPPLVDIRLDKGSSFLNQKEAGIFAKGDARITLNAKSWRAMSDKTGGKAKVVGPAAIEFE